MSEDSLRGDGDGRGQRFSPLLANFDAEWVGEVSGETADDLPSILCRAATRVLPVDGAGLCVSVGSGLRLPLGASDSAAATAERLQFTAGEGPCFEAMAEGHPISVDLAEMARRWPVLAVLHQQATPYRTGLAVPLRVGGDPFGVLDLYSRGSDRADARDVAEAEVIARAAADVLLAVLAPEAPGAGVPPSSATWLDSDSVRRRRDVWVAIGMASMTLDLDHDDALSTLRASAVGREQSLDEYARALVAGDEPLQALDLG